MAYSEETLRRMIREMFGQYLTSEEMEQLLPHAKRQLEISQKLEELDLGRGDPQATHYIRDRRLGP